MSNLLDQCLDGAGNQIAFACADVAATVQGLRARGISLMRVPDNYYVDLDAWFGLRADFVEHLRRHQLLYDRDPDGELLHAYTEVLPTGFYVEVLERRGSYDGYGVSNTHVRLVAQATGQASPSSPSGRSVPARVP